MRPNERFSGGGHAGHVCKDCGKLGHEELAYRQAVRDIDRMLQWETGRMKRKQRSNFSKFLGHPIARIREYAESVADGETDLRVDDDFAGPQAFELVWEEEDGRGTT